MSPECSGHQTRIYKIDQYLYTKVLRVLALRHHTRQRIVADLHYNERCAYYGRTINLCIFEVSIGCQKANCLYDCLRDKVDHGISYV